MSNEWSSRTWWVDFSNGWNGRRRTSPGGRNGRRKMVELFSEPTNQDQVTCACARSGWPAELAHQVDDSNGRSCFQLDGNQVNCVCRVKKLTIRNHARKIRHRTPAHVEEERRGEEKKRRGEEERRGWAEGSRGEEDKKREKVAERDGEEKGTRGIKNILFLFFCKHTQSDNVSECVKDTTKEPTHRKQKQLSSAVHPSSIYKVGCDASFLTLTRGLSGTFARNMTCP